MVSYQVGQFAAPWLHSNEDQRSLARSASTLYSAFITEHGTFHLSCCMTRCLYILTRYTQRNPMACRTCNRIKGKQHCLSKKPSLLDVIMLNTTCQMIENHLSQRTIFTIRANYFAGKSKLLHFLVKVCMTLLSLFFVP